MGETLSEIPEYLIEWIKKQHVFWVASAPLSADGHVNVSPKGIEGTFHIVNSRRVWYEDLSGSGAETIAHIRENGRVTVLFNAFDGPPRIVRLYGKGTIHEIGSQEYEYLLPSSIRQPGSRAVIIIDVFKVGTTCGWAVPFYAFQSHRSQLIDWAAKKERTDRICGGGSSEKGMMAWWRTRNAESLDGLPALALAQKSSPPPKVLLRSPTQTQTGLLSGYALAFMLGVAVASLAPIHAAKNPLLWSISSFHR